MFPVKSLSRKFVCLNFKRSVIKPTQQYVPKHDSVKPSDIKKLEKFLSEKPGILVVTGAGVSTESGIPDYR